MSSTSSFAVVSAFVVLAACTGDDVATGKRPFEDPAATASQLCDEMCTKALTKCSGDATIYAETSECLATCQALDLGVAASGTGNTVRCRIAQLDANNCKGGSVLGGGVCGGPCDGFCKLTSKACPGGAGKVANPFGDEGTCLETCRAKFRFDPDGPQGGAISIDTDTLNCRSQHLLLATKNPDPHCTHLPENSSLCSK